MKRKLIITEAQYNRLKNNLIKEEMFSWDGTYANEDVNEMAMGDDIELPLEEDLDEACGCPLNQPEPTDVKDSQWFSKEDGERTIDNIYN